MGRAQTMSLIAAIIAESETVSITRRAAGTHDATSGLYVQGADSAVVATASLQPLSMREIEALPEGIRQRASFKLYTATELHPTDPTTQALGDQFTHNGITYEVTGLQNWSTHGGYFKYIAIKAEQ